MNAKFVRGLPEFVIIVAVVYCGGVAVWGAVTVGSLSALPVERLLLLGAPAGLGAVAALALLLPRRWRTNIALALGSLAFAVFVGEAFFTITDPNRATHSAGRLTFWNAAHEARQTFDVRSAFEVVRDLRTQDVDAVPAMTAGRVRSTVAGPGGRALPVLGGVSMATTVLCNESGQFAIYDADEHGFNNPRGLHEHMPQIVLIGDSFTHGSCVPREASIAGHVRTAFPATLNLGMTGTGPLLQLAAFKEYAAPLRPRFVVWNWFEENDLDDLRRELTWEPIRSYLTNDGQFGLRDRQTDIDRTLRSAIDARMQGYALERLLPAWQVDRLLLRSIRRRLNLGGAFTLTRIDRDRMPSIEEALTVTEGILATVRDAARKWGGELVVVYLPGTTRYCGQVSGWREYCATEAAQHLKARVALRDDVLTMFMRLGLPVADGHAAFVEAGRLADMFYYPGSHYSADGYRVIAEAALRKLGERLAADEAMTSVPRFRHPAGLGTAGPVRHGAPSASAFNPLLQVDKALEGR